MLLEELEAMDEQNDDQPIIVGVVGKDRNLRESPFDEKITPIAGVVGRDGNLRESPFDEKITPPVATMREKARLHVAQWLLWILAGSILYSFLLMSGILIFTKDDSKIEEKHRITKDILTFMITSQIGLVGTALGFYFAGKE